MNEYRGKHTSSVPWAVSSTASSNYRSRHTLKNRRRRRMLIAFAVFLALVLAYPFLEALIIRVDRISLVSNDLPADIGHLSVVYLTDIHYGFFFSDGRVNALVNQLNSLKPDLVLFGGDSGDDPSAAISFYQQLPSIHARYAIAGVLGESDHGKDDLERTLVTDAMRNAGVTPLVNEVLPVRIGTSIIYVAGLDDVLSGRPDLASIASRVSMEDYVILLSHNPSVIPDAQRLPDRNNRLGWFDLALFGHTHGGQIRGLESLLDIGGDVNSRYQSGLLTENRSNLLISNGVGSSVIPARLFCPPQVHCIDISLP